MALDHPSEIVDNLKKANYYATVKLLTKINRIKRRGKKISTSALGSLSKIWDAQKNTLIGKIKPLLFKYKLSLTLFKRQLSLTGQKPIHRSAVDAVNFIWNKKGTIFNYTAPVMALCMLFLSIHYYTNITWALEIEYAGDVIGYVETETDYYEAKRLVTERIINEEYKEPESANVKFTLVPIEEETISDSFYLSDQIILASDNEIATASGLYVDGKFLGAVTDHEDLLLTMESMLDPYQEQYPDAKIGFVNNIQLKEGLYPLSSIVDYSEVAEVITSEAMGESTYTVESGDSPWAIASKTNTSVNQLISLNPIIETRLIPGDELVIEAATPYLDIKVTTTEEYTESIPYEVENINDSSMIKGQTAIATAGVKGEKEIVAEVTYLNGYPIETTVLSTQVLSEPVNQVVKVGTNTLSNAPTSISSNTNSVFIWPTSGYISAGWYSYPGHSAIDIAAPTGTPIYAAASGTVSMVKNSYTGYGRHLMINHGSGVETLYAHNTSIVVSQGQYVHQGQLIAYMGSTGNSTGSHCHFEVRINGSFKNPMNYLP